MVVLYQNSVIELRNERNQLGQNVYKRIQRICNYIHITEVKNNTVTKEKDAVVSYISTSGDMESKEFPLDMLSDKNEILSLSRYGVDINSYNSMDVVRHINNELMKAQSMQVISQAGIVFLKNTCCYIGQKAIYAKNNSIYKKHVQYIGKLDIREQGDYSIYKNMLLQEVVPSVFLSTALAIGISSMLVSYLGSEIQVQNLLVHISGDSSTGKSTALHLCLSPYGGKKNRPEKTSLFSTWNTTDNALFEMLADNYGIAIGLDEAGMTRSKSFASLIYRIVEGREKLRMNYGTGNEKVREWHTTIISTGEIPLHDAADQATGQKVRLLDLESVPWTDDAEHSQRILSVLQNNYGFLGIRTAKKLLLENKSIWLSRHQKETDKLMKRLDCGSLNARIANQLAVIVLAGTLLNKVKIPVSVNQIRDFLCEVANDTLCPANAMPEKAYEKLCTQITKMQNQIEIRARNGTPLCSVSAGSVWGVARVEERQAQKTSLSHAADLNFQSVYLPKIAIEDFLTENGYHNTNVILRSWQESGHIAADKSGSITFRVKIGNVNVKCLKVVL